MSRKVQRLPSRFQAKNDAFFSPFNASCVFVSLNRSEDSYGSCSHKAIFMLIVISIFVFQTRVVVPLLFFITTMDVTLMKRGIHGEYYPYLKEWELRFAMSICNDVNYKYFFRLLSVFAFESVSG